MPLFLSIFSLFIPSVAVRHVRTAFTTVGNFLSWAPRVAIARLLAKWRSLLTIIVGVILGAGIGALIPLYTTAIAQLGLTQRMEDEPLEDTHVQLRIGLNSDDFVVVEDDPSSVDRAALDNFVAAADSVVEDTVDLHFTNDENLEGWVNTVSAFIETDKMGLTKGETLIPGTRASLIYLEDWEDKVNVYEGTLPSQTEVPEGADFNVAISLETAISSTVISSEEEIEDEAGGLNVGDFITVDQDIRYGDGRRGGYATSQPMVAYISGIVEPKDPDDAFWMKARSGSFDEPLAFQPSAALNWEFEFKFLTDETAVREVASEFVPETRTYYGWRVIFDHEELSYVRIDDAQTALENFDRDVYAALKLQPENRERETNFFYHTCLVDFRGCAEEEGILQDYSEKQSANFGPFTLLLLQIGALVLFFLMVTAMLVRRSERREISMLQSRGAFGGQIIALRGVEALIICIFGGLVAPLLAQQLLIALGPTVAGTDEFPLPLTWPVFAFSFAAAAITFVALTLTLVPVLRLPLISGGGASLRSGKMSWWQKYYVDVIISVVGLAGLVWLIDQDSPFLQTDLGEQRVDVLLLVAPAFLFLGLGSIALRVFPMLASGMAIITSRTRGLVGSLSSWQLSREPIHYARITFLLALAVAIGWFATSFRATVQRSQDDQARYLVGSDARFSEFDRTLGTQRSQPLQNYVEHPDVEAASAAYRVQNVSYRDGSIDILAVDPRNFGDVTLDYWRSDLGPIRVPRGPQDFLALPPVGEALPLTPERFGMWVRMDSQGFGGSSGTIIYVADLARLIQRTDVFLRLQDEDGVWVHVPLEAQLIEYQPAGEDVPGFATRTQVTSGWVYYEGDFTDVGYEPSGDFRLVSIYWEHRSTPGAGGGTGSEQNIRIAMANMVLIDENGNETPYPILSEGDWEFLYHDGALVTLNFLNQGGLLDGLRCDGVQVSDSDSNILCDTLDLSFDQDALFSRMGINLNYPSLPTVASNADTGAFYPMTAVISESLASSFGEDNVLSEDAGEGSAVSLLRVAASGTREALDESFGDPKEVNISLDNVDGVPLLLVATAETEYFPTLYNEDRPFAIIDVRELMFHLNRRPAASFYPDEVWLQLNEEVNEPEEAEAVLREITGGTDSGRIIVDPVTYAEEFDKLETDPLALGLLGLMYLASIIALALSVVGLLSYAALTAQARRTEFGILRAMGLASSRVVGSLMMEQMFVVVLAGLLGSGLGYILSVFVVPTLAVGTTGGDDVVPPFITETEWAAIGQFWLVMAFVLVLVFGFTLVLVRQLSLSRTLRLGDE